MVDVRTYPVTKVPTSAPNVEMPLNRPTTPPVRWRSWSCSFTTIGVTALSTSAGKKNAAMASESVVPRPPPPVWSPSARTIGTVNSASKPPTHTVAPSRRRGSIQSASFPPTNAPAAMPASTVPMMEV